MGAFDQLNDKESKLHCHNRRKFVFLDCETHQGALFESYLLCVSPLIPGEAWTIDVSHIDFQTRHNLSSLSAPFFCFFFFSSLVFQIQFCFFTFISLAIYILDLPCTTVLCLALLTIRIGVGKKDTFTSPLLQFPNIPEEGWFNRCPLVRLTVTSKGASHSGCLSIATNYSTGCYYYLCMVKRKKFLSCMIGDGYPMCKDASYDYRLQGRHSREVLNLHVALLGIIDLNRSWMLHHRQSSVYYTLLGSHLN